MTGFIMSLVNINQELLNWEQRNRLGDDMTALIWGSGLSNTWALGLACRHTGKRCTVYEQSNKIYFINELKRYLPRYLTYVHSYVHTYQHFVVCSSTCHVRKRKLIILYPKLSSSNLMRIFQTSNCYFLLFMNIIFDLRGSSRCPL